MSGITVNAGIQTTVIITIDSIPLPPQIAIYSAVIREDTLYAVPTLDLVLADPANIIGSAIKLLDGTLITCSIFSTDEVSPLTFKVASVNPSKRGTTSFYTINAYYKSDLLFPKDAWTFTGNASDALQNIISLDINANSVKYMTNFVSTSELNKSNYKKYANESFAGYFRRVLFPSMPLNAVSYFAYYHSGFTVKLMNLLALLQNYTQTDTSPVLTANSYMQWVLNSNSMHSNLQNTSYGGAIYQFNIHDGTWQKNNEAKGYAKYNINQDSTIVNKQVNIVGSSVGNHPAGYLSGMSQNIKNKGAFNVELTVQLNYQTNFQGLQVIPLYYDKSKYIPLIVGGKSIIMRNGMYEEQIKFIANQIDQSILSTLGISTQGGG
jgi:hypothetical protein